MGWSMQNQAIIWVQAQHRLMLIDLLPAAMPGGEGLLGVDSGLRPVLQVVLICEGMSRADYHHAEHMTLPTMCVHSDVPRLLSV